jgi:hypothetical protein
MSFEEQAKSHTCGLASLRYALSLLGIGLRGAAEVSETDIGGLIGKGWLHARVAGYSEHELARAASRLGLSVRRRRWRDAPAAAVRSLRSATAKGHPCIVSVHDDDNPHFHWMCVAGFVSPDRAVVLDPSALDDGRYDFRRLDSGESTVVGLMSASRLQAWLTPTDRGESGEDQFFLELSPASPRFAARFTWHDGLTRVMTQHEHFAPNFDEYVDEMRTAFPGPGRLRAADLLDDVRAEVIREATQWVAVPAREATSLFSRELDAWTAVAKAYDLRVGPGREPYAVATLTGLLGWRAAEYMYDAGRYE